MPDKLLGLVDNEDSPSILEKLVAEGKHGIKSGQGFYDYSGQTPEEITQNSEEQLYKMRKFMRDLQILDI